MLVDDESITLDTIQIFLEDAGYQHFVLTSDAREAIPTLERERPDIVLLDLMMPHVSGFEILAYIRGNERFEHLPVVVLTSSSDAPTRLRALEMGATDFLAKPVDESELVLRVRNTLNAKAYQDRLANFDHLTGLPNRQMLVDRLEWAMRQAQYAGQCGALLHIDIKRFRRLNEALGPALADELLQHVARRLSTELQHDPVAAVLLQTGSISELSRLGGDEFALLLNGNLHPDHIVRIARRLLDAMATPFRLRSQDLYLTVNIGIATFPDDGLDTNKLLGNAGVAVRSLQAEQSNASGALCFYAPELNERASDRLDLETELRHAMERDELRLYYQPKYDVATEKVIGAEGLLRWNHAQRGFISPSEFIPLAEETGLIVEIGRRAIEEACDQLANWTAKGLDAGVIAVNVSVQQFREASFVDHVRGALARFGVDAHQLKIEVTESLLMTEQEKAATMLGELRTLGLHLSIDDFGTGYSSLSYLRTLPIDELKIDRSFLIDVDTSTDSAAIVRAILALAHSLDMTVVAEGVETQEQLAFLRAHNCDACQGFFFSKAIPASEYEGLLAPAVEA